MKPVIYEGNEAYIFVSYSHKDAEAVFAVLNELQAQGYRFWYDAGIAPGSEWPEDIAVHLDAAEVVLAFITPNSMASHNCRREINFSLSRGKPFLSIYLEETEMSLGMQMQLSAQQSVKRYNYDTWEGFINRILKCPDIERCREEQVTESPQKSAQPPIASEFTPKETAKPETTADNDRPGQSQVEIVEPGDNQSSQNTVETIKPNTGPSTENKSSKTGMIIGLVVAVIVIAAIAFFALGPKDQKDDTSTAPTSSVTEKKDASSTIATSWGSEIETDSISVYADGETVAQSDLDSIASLEALKKIELKNCDFSSCDFSSLSFSSNALESLDLSGSTGIKSFEFLSNLALQSLNLEGLDSFDDLSVVNATKLTELNIGGTAVKSLDALDNAPLEKLVFRNTAIGDLSPVAKMPDLQTLDGANSQVTSIDAILELEKLQSICFNGCKIDYPDSPLAALSLSTANLADTGLTDLSLLAYCTILKTLDISRNGDLSAMDDLDAKNYSTLVNLNVAQTSLEADDLSFVSQCSNLEKLVLDGCSLHNLKCCNGLGALTYLSAINCDLDDIDDLAGCTLLGSVILSCNNIEDVSALSNLTKAQNRSFTDGKIVLELTSNKVKSIANLPAGEYEAVMLYDNAESVASTVPNGLKSEQLVISWCEGLGDSGLANQDYSSTIYLVDCPKNEVLETKDALSGGKFNISGSKEFISKEELLDLYKNDAFGRELTFDVDYFLSVVEF